MAVQKKQSIVPPSQGPLSDRTIQNQRKGKPRIGENGSFIGSERKTAGCHANKPPQICNATSPRAAAANGLNVDERLRAARERREEHQRILASRESSRLERELRAKRFYQLQLQERKKKLQEQRVKEERRRAAVEEKRKQRLREEKERHESAVRRTLEKSQKAQQSLSQITRGRKSSRNVSFHSIDNNKQQQRQQLKSSSCNNQRSFNLTQIKAAKQQNAIRKNSPVTSNVRPALSEAGERKRTAPPSPERTPHRSVRRSDRRDLPSVPEEDAVGNRRPPRSNGGQGAFQGDEGRPKTPHPRLVDTQRNSRTGTPTKTALNSAPQEATDRASAGTTDANEASRLLAEKRKEARIQREKEETERRQREEAERRNRDDLERRRAEERAREEEEEARRLVEEKKRREEEEQRRAEEERAEAMKEAVLLQRQREEELANERARLERLQKEREILAQKEEAERQVRKKRLEEIMRRTRRTDSPDTKPVQGRILASESEPKENTEPARRAEEDRRVPAGTKTVQTGMNNEDDAVPVVAFKERRSLRTLGGLEEIQTQQRAEVI